MNAIKIRQQFIDYFIDKNHKFVRSAGVVPFDDPTLLFTNAGMNQFKGIFLGNEEATTTRAVNSQKCIRVSGKHNDLEEVGKDGYHHTFFEMLGNWSFGDYYKKEAITWAWELFTEVFKIPKEKLYATVYKTDDEAFDIWANETDIPKDHILRFGDKDNFWEMGETGPCGPCSELHIDLGGDEDIHGNHPTRGVNSENHRFIELWNLVFIQYFRDEDGKLTELPSKHVDTGAGLERIVAYLQGKSTNYDTDLFQPIIQHIAKLSGVAYKEGVDGIAHRVIADHIRMLTFSITDGALPSNDGRGYVLRRILRRAARFGRNLGMKESFIYKLVPTVVDIMGAAYPELLERSEYVANVVKAEEESFLKTLDRGISIFEEMVAAAKTSNANILSGEAVFKLYDTFGFPVDLTTMMAEEVDLDVDIAGFEKSMSEQRAKGRKQGQFKATHKQNDKWTTLSDEAHSAFIGYASIRCKTKVVKILENEEGTFVLLKETPFYAESGGQVADHGTIKNQDFTAKILDVQKVGDSIIHSIDVIEGTVNGNSIEASVCMKRRNAVSANHSATHLLNAVLRKKLGTHVKQSGSLVNTEHLRFDFNHFQKVSSEELQAIENEINDLIRANIPNDIVEQSFNEAKSAGALAFFGDKYGDVVRTVRFGDASMELCGGIHVKATGNIGYFRITSESSIAAGIRRIEAITGQKAEAMAQGENALLKDISEKLKTDPKGLSVKVDQLLSEKNDLEKEFLTLKQSLSKDAISNVLAQGREINGIHIYSAQVVSGSMDEFKEMADDLRHGMDSGVGVLATVMNEQPYVVCVVTDDLIASKKIKAGDIVRELGQILGGGGGGKPHLATAGGKDVDKIDEALKKLYLIIEEKAVWKQN
jgi:alanyl-tRNA synthetase